MTTDSAGNEEVEALPAQEAPLADRQRTIEVLCEAFANDEMVVEEFERRVEAAHRASSAEELGRLLRGLPSGSGLPAEADSQSAPVRGPATAPSSEASGSSAWGYSVGVMGGASQSGSWQPARRNVAIGVMGGCTLDFREALLAPGLTEVYAVAFWGGIEIIVPPWLRVQTSGLGIMGGFDHHHDTASVPAADAPTLRISGVAVMAGVEVKVRLPGESGRDPRKRIREERRVRRLTDRSQHRDDE